MPYKPPKAAPKCPACGSSVYPAEQVMAGDRKPYHKHCVKCVNCKKVLNPSTLNNHKDQLFCSPCYQNIFNPQDAKTHVPPDLSASRNQNMSMFKGGLQDDLNKMFSDIKRTDC